MFPVDGGEDPPDTRARVIPNVLRTPRRMQGLLGIALAAILLASPAATLAGDAKIAAEKPDHTVAFGLTAGQLALAASLGAGAGAAGALVSGNMIAGAASLGFGTLAAIYVAHLAAEAVVLGGMYYWWPWGAEPEAPASRTMAIRGTN
jgi:hypothetical protein